MYYAKKNISYRKWRLVVRNVSFDCSENDLRTAFSKYGEISEIVMPQKNGGFAGFCFIQFKTHDNATKALSSFNGQNLKGRVVAVDWAMPKDQYMTAVIEEKQKSSENAPIKPKGIKFEDDKDDDECSTSEDDDAEDAESDVENETPTKPTTKPIPRTSDVGEGKTLFIRGVPFEAEEEEFKGMFEKFGPLKYALICRYKDSDMSKGSGFVQFLQKSDADSCLAKSIEMPGLVMKGRRFTVCAAVAKNEAASLSAAKSENTEKHTDKRNLHLLRVGLIRQGTREAADMSDVDAKKRLKIEANNRQKIKNGNIFVSPTRLVVHNLPTNFDDKQLKRICYQAVDDKKASIKECRIMRDFDRQDTKGEAKSKGYAFVEFEKHEHALNCLKTLNNNPETFIDIKRPIVEFSLENRLALNAKAIRLEKSRENLKKNIPVKEKNFSMMEPAKKKQKMIFKAPVVPAPANAPKNPFPSHMGPKIRMKKRVKAAGSLNKKKKKVQHEK